MAPNDSDRIAARERLTLPQQKILILFAGQIIERKGVADLLHAWNQLAAVWRDRADLLIIGDDIENHGAYRRQMEQLAAELTCPVRFLGFQKNVPDWLTAADLVLVPSHAEPLGNATLEAMAHARPVIGCRVGGIPEMVTDGETGLLVPARSPAELASAIERLLQAPDLRTTLGQQARQQCEERFSLNAHVEAVLRIYDDVRLRHVENLITERR